MRKAETKRVGKERAKTHERGQATLEYVYLTMAFLGVFFMPTPFPQLDYRPVYSLMMDAFTIYLDSFHAVIGLPIP